MRIHTPVIVGAALCALLLSWTVLAPVVVAQQVEAGDGEAVIRNGGGAVRAGDGCAVIESGEEAVIAGSCDEEGGEDRQSDDPAPRESASPNETTSVEETISEQTASLEETTSLGEPTAPETDDACPTQLPDDAVGATVERAVDGDTLELSEPVSGKDTVRLIGVDAPELSGADGPEFHAEEATRFTAEALDGQEVLLDLGEDAEDDHGRLLAHVWTAPEDGVMGGVKRVFGAGRPELFNRTLVEEGYAEILTVRPNELYEACFEQVERQARETGAGVWGAKETSREGQYEEDAVPEGTVTDHTGSDDTYAEIAPPGEVLPEDAVRETTISEESTLQDPAEETAPPDRPDAGAAEDQYESEDRSVPPAAREIPASPVPPEPSADRGVGTSTPSGSPTVGLPVRQTSRGPQPILPDTGGERPTERPAPALLAGVGLVALGLSALAALRADGRHR